MSKGLIDRWLEYRHGDELRAQAAAQSQRKAEEAGRYCAARYTRGNVAIQHGRMSDFPARTRGTSGRSD